MRSYAQDKQFQFQEQELSTKRRRVRFSETSEMVLVTKLSEGSDKHNIWFAQDELNLFKANMTSYINVVRLQVAKRRAPTASNILGMEKFLTIQLTEEYKFRRAKVAKEVMNTVRLQQMLAAHGNRLDYDKSVDVLAKVAAEHSKWALERARAAALFLEQDQETKMRRELEKQSMKDHQDNFDNSPISASSSRRQFAHQSALRETKRSRITPPTCGASSSLASMDKNITSHPNFMRTVSPTIEDASSSGSMTTVFPPRSFY